LRRPSITVEPLGVVAEGMIGKVPQGVGMLREAGVAPPTVLFPPVKPPITATTVP
jgi:hypothetical protein